MADREENGTENGRSNGDAREITPRPTVAARVKRYREELGNVLPFGQSARDLVANQQKLLLMLQNMTYVIGQLDREVGYVQVDLQQPRMSEHLCEQIRREEAARRSRQEEQDAMTYREDNMYVRHDDFNLRLDTPPLRAEMLPRSDFRPISLISERRELDGSAYSFPRERDSVKSGDSRWSADLYRAGSAASSGQMKLSRSGSVSSVSSWRSDDASSAYLDSEEEEGGRWVVPPRDPAKKPLEIKR